MPQIQSNPTTSSNATTVAKPKRLYRTADQWREIIEAYQRSHLTCAEFCKQHGIATSGLYSWQRKFEQQDASRIDDDAFVQLQAPVVPTNTPDQKWDVELELGHGRVLRVRMA